MAQVFYKVSGGQVQEADAETIGDLRRIANAKDMIAKVSNDIVEDDYALDDSEVVFFAENKKGA